MLISPTGVIYLTITTKYSIFPHQDNTHLIILENKNLTVESQCRKP